MHSAISISGDRQTAETSAISFEQNADSPKKARRIPELDGLRGVAILLVVCLHYITDSEGGELGSFLYRFKALFRLGWSGVDLFFVLSGFLIGGILLQARGSSNYYQTFYLRRVHRIFPIYYTWILLYVLIRLAAPELIPHTLPLAADGLHRVPAYVLFLQNWISMPFKTFDWYWFAVTWSLAVEEQFYLIAPVLIRSLSLRATVFTLCATVVLAPVLRECVFRWTPQSSMYWYVLMPCRADSLALGMLAAIAWKSDGIRSYLMGKKGTINSLLAFLFCGLLILLKFFPGPSAHVTAVWGFSWLGFFFVTLLISVLVDSRGKLAAALRWRWLMQLGGISYCFYLIHLPVDGILHALLLHSPPTLATVSGIGVTLLAALFTFGLATISWKYLEGPMVRRGHHYGYDSDTRAVLSVGMPASPTQASG